MALNSFSFCMSVKFFIFLPNLNESLAMQSILDCNLFLFLFFFLFSPQVYCAIPFWPSEFLLKNQLITLWGFPCILFVAFPLSLLLCSSFNFCHFDYQLSQCVPLWVNPAWDSLHFLDLGDCFLFHVRLSFQLSCFQISSQALSLPLLLLGPLWCKCWCI